MSRWVPLNTLSPCRPYNNNSNQRPLHHCIQSVISISRDKIKKINWNFYLRICYVFFFTILIVKNQYIYVFSPIVSFQPRHIEVEVMTWTSPDPLGRQKLRNVSAARQPRKVESPLEASPPQVGNSI